MLNIESILQYMHDQIVAGSERYKLIDDEHVLDTKTGVKFHLYDDWSKATYDGEVILKMSDLTTGEQQVLWKIKQMITDPTVAKKKREDYPILLKQRREKLSELFENPTPVMLKEPVVEADAEVYAG